MIYANGGNNMTTILGELKEQCLKEIREAWDFAQAEYGVSLHHIPVHFSNALTTTAGNCHFRRANGKLTVEKITLSIEILYNEKEAFVRRTPKHEAAHAIAIAVFNDSSHGYTWQRIAVKLGISPERCHKFVVRRREPQTKYPVYCACDKPHMVTSRILSSMDSGRRIYSCRVCKNRITRNKNS